MVVGGSVGTTLTPGVPPPANGEHAVAARTNRLSQSPERLTLSTEYDRGVKLAIVLAVMLASACGAPATTQIPSLVPTVAPTARPLDRPVDTPPPVSAVPLGIMEAILEEAASLASVDPDQVLVVRAEPAVWRDGSLGCPRPDEMYTQALVNGYWVVVEAGGRQYDFRVGNNAEFRLCEQPPGGPSTTIEIPPDIY